MTDRQVGLAWREIICDDEMKMEWCSLSQRIGEIQRELEAVMGEERFGRFVQSLQSAVIVAGV